MATSQPGTQARAAVRDASAETIARYLAPRGQTGAAKPRPPPFGTDDSRPDYGHRGNSRAQEKQARPVTPQQAFFQFGDEDDGPSHRAAPKDALDGFISSKANPLVQKKAPASIFGGASGRPITAGDVFPDDAPAAPDRPPSGARPPSGRRGGPPKPPAPPSVNIGVMGRGAAPLQPTSGRRDATSNSAYGQPALGASGGKGSFGMGAIGDAMPAAGAGRRRPQNASSGTFVF